MLTNNVNYEDKEGPALSDGPDGSPAEHSQLGNAGLDVVLERVLRQKDHRFCYTLQYK